MAKAPKEEKLPEKEDSAPEASVPAVAKASGLPSAEFSSFEEDAGLGSEHITSQDQLIPFVNILQKLSPQVDKRNGAYIQGAEEGMFINTATKELFNGDTGIFAVPIIFQRRYTVWVPRSKGGGLVGDFGSDDSILKQGRRDEATGKLLTPDGNEIVTSLTYYAFLVDPEKGTYVPAVLSMSGTQQKKARLWNTLITNLRIPRANGGTFNPASFYRAYKLTTVPESNDKGAWMGWKIEYGPDVKDIPNGMDIYQAAREFLAKINEGTVKADMSSEDRHEGGNAAANADVPF